ncbi:MAG: IS21 family transposase, partial [Gelidibacter sp.]
KLVSYPILGKMGLVGWLLLFHYQQYVQTAKEPYSYTQFMEHYNRKFTKAKGSMKPEHDPGNEMYMDYAGKKLHFVDRATGELIAVEVFVVILPNSKYTYV